MKLYEIDLAFRTLWEKIAEQDGEMTEEDIKALDDLELAKDEKIKAYGVLIREYDKDMESYYNEIQRLQNEFHKLKEKRDWLFDRLKAFMLEHNELKFNSPEVNIVFRKSYPIYGAEQAFKDGKLPKQFITQTVTEKPDKTAIKAFLKDGGTIEGVYIGEEQNMSVK